MKRQRVGIMINLDNAAEIWTEGQTDVLHMKKAIQVLNFSEKLFFKENLTDQGDMALFKKCQIFAEKYQAKPMIFIFDRDNKNLIKHISDKDGNYKNWGNNVFSFAIPIPSHRKGYKNICLELYYKDEELRTIDESGHRLFLTSEFNKDSGKLKSDPSIHIDNIGKLKGFTDIKSAKIVASNVFGVKNKNIALSKMKFASYILSGSPSFNSFGFVEFEKIFEIISNIIEPIKTSTTRKNKNVLLENASQIKANEKGIASNDEAQRFFDQLLFQLRKDIERMVRQICIDRNIFPPMEVNYYRKNGSEGFELIFSFPFSEKHHLFRSLHISLKIIIKELVSQTVSVEYTTIFKEGKIKDISILKFNKLINAPYNQDLFKNQIQKKFISIFKHMVNKSKM